MVATVQRKCVRRARARKVARQKLDLASRDQRPSRSKNHLATVGALLCLLLLSSTALFGLLGCGTSGGADAASSLISLPTITSLTPASGAVGASITIAGSNFGAMQGTSTVTFNETLATPTSWSASSIVVPVPAGATSGTVVVAVAGLASIGANFVVPAIVTSLSSSTGPVGGVITITGSNFGTTQGTGTVAFNGIAVTTITSWSNTSILAVVPIGAVAGDVVVTVNGVASNGIFFTPGPSITSLSITSGPAGAALIITGLNFGATQGSSTVTFNTILATSVSSWSSTAITVLVPASASTGSVVVKVNFLNSNGVSFTVVAPPQISSLGASTAAVNTSLVITGSNFGASQGSSTVTFNGLTANTATSWASGSITVTIPIGATAGNVIVVVGGIDSNGVAFTPGPSVTGLSPSAGQVATSVVISGTQFGAARGASTITFNGTPATPTSWSSTSIVASVPTGATTGAVVVTVNSLASNNTQPFTVTAAQILPNCASSPTGDETKLNGTYVLLVQGWTGSGTGTPIATITSFIANGAGAIQGGEGDSNDSGSGPHHFSINATGGASNSLYKVGKDATGSGDIGCVALSNSLGATTTFEFSLGKVQRNTYTRGKLIQFDDTTGTGTRGSGILLLQDPAQFAFPAAPTNLVFGESGWDINGKSFAGAGFLTVSTAGAFTNLSADFNDNGTVNYGLGADSPIPGAPDNGGFNAAPDPVAGYTTLTDHYAVGATTQTLHYAAYEVNPDEYLYISTDPITAFTSLASGRAIGTSSSFSNSSLNGSYVLHQTGSTGTAAEVGLGLLTFTPASTAISGTFDQYQTGSALQAETPTVTYSINSSTGRVALTSPSGFGTDDNKPVMYITQHNNSYTEPIDGFVIGTDADATFGILQASTNAPYTTASLNGNYFFGSENPGDNTATDGVGVAALTGGAGLCVGTQHLNGPTGSSPGLAIQSLSPCGVTITNRNGFGNVGPGTVLLTNGEAVFYLFDASGEPAEIMTGETE